MRHKPLAMGSQNSHLDLKCAFLQNAGHLNEIHKHIGCVFIFCLRKQNH